MVLLWIVIPMLLLCNCGVIENCIYWGSNIVLPNLFVKILNQYFLTELRCCRAVCVEFVGVDIQSVLLCCVIL